MMLLKLAWRNLFRNKRRTFITAASVFFAVVFACLMRSIQLGTYEKMIENSVGNFTGYVQLQHPDYDSKRSLEYAIPITIKDSLQSIASSGISAITPRIEHFALAAIDSTSKGVFIIGADWETEQRVIDPKSRIIDGQLPSKLNEVLIADGLMEDLNLSLLDTIALITQGYHGINAAHLFTISGRIKFPTAELNKTLIMLSLNDCQAFLGMEYLVTSLVITPEKFADAKAIAVAINNQNMDHLIALSWYDLVPELVQLIEADNAGGKIMLAILYVLIGFGIFGTILMMTEERKYEFGILNAIGMKRFKIILMIVLESIFVSMLGVVLGILAAFPILTYFYYNPISLGADLEEYAAQYDFEPVLTFSLNPEIFTMQSIYVFFMAVLISFYPIYVISRLNIVKALKG